ncbi:MAG: hypothetical protein WBD47_16400 [Phormidesmis sp.]
MKAPNVIFKDGALSEIKAKVPSLDTQSEVKQVVADRTSLAERIAKKGLDRLDHILAGKRRRDKKNRWKSDKIAVAFFGDDLVSVAEIKAVRRRLKRAHRRLAKRELNIRLLPQSRASKHTVSGHNTGGPLTPLRFVLFPRWFKIATREGQAVVIIHELMHDWFIDHKVKDGGKRKTAYGERLAKKLAAKKPLSARRNPENYEQFCLAVWNS